MIYCRITQMEVGAPCLSFDVLKDSLGDNRSEVSTRTTRATRVGFTQPQKAHVRDLGGSGEHLTGCIITSSLDLSS